MENYQKELLDKNKVLLVGEINERKVEEVIEKILSIELKNNDDIVLIINSTGGNLTDAFMLVDIMEFVKNKIITIGLGSICSAGLLIFMAGDERRITKNVSILSHQYYWKNSGKYHELRGKRKEEDLIMRRILEHYKKYTGLSEKEIKKYLLRETDTWLSPKEAIKYHLADKII